MTTAPHSAWSSTAWRELLASPAYASLKPTARLVFQTLRNYSDVTGRPCWPSVATLATACGLKPRACQVALAHLEAAGLIAREGRSGSSTVYHFARPNGLVMRPPPLHVDAPPLCASMHPKEEQRIKSKNQEQPDSPSGLRPTGENRMSRKPAQDTDTLWSKASPDPDRIVTSTPLHVLAQARLDKPERYEAKAAKNAAAALVDYWYDKRAVDDPSVKPPTPTPKDRGLAKAICARFRVSALDTPGDAFRKARVLVDLAFKRTVWPFTKGEPVTLAAIAKRETFDKLRAAEAERVAALPDWQRQGFASFADWVEAENARGGFRRVG